MSNGFMRNLALRQGSGLEMKADQSGGRHMLTAGLADQYAAAGQTLPANLQPAMRELDGLIAEEVSLSKVSPQTRYALAGSGYDPLARKRRVSELEDFLLTQSADARTIGDRLKNQMAEVQIRQAEANVVATEQQNSLLADTYDATVSAKRSGLMLQVANNQQSLTAIETANAQTEITKSAYGAGLSLPELYQVYESNDADALKQVFGTTDRMMINGTLMGMSTAQNKHNAEALEAMQGAVQMSALRLAGDATITNEQLQSMASGDLAAPEGVSMLAVAQAMVERQAVMAARTSLTAARTQGIKNEAELNQLVYGSMTLQQQADTLAGMLGVDAASVLQAIQSGQTDSLMAAAAKAEPAQISDPTGQPFMAQPQAMVAALVESYNARAGQITHQLLATSALQRFEVQRKENLRVLGQQAAIMGQPAPPHVQNQISTYVDQATAMWRQAVLPTTSPERRAELEAAAEQAFTSAREVLTKFMKDSGVPAHIVKDVEQGRISSNESYKAAALDAVAYGASRFENQALGQAWTNILKAKGINSHDIAEWQKNGELNTLTDLSHGKLFGSNKVAPEDITKLVDGVGRVAMTNAMLETIMTNSWSQYLDKNMLDMLQPLLSGEAEKERGLDPNDALRRTMLVARMIDESATLASENARRAGNQDAPAYVRGAIFRTFQDSMNDGSRLRDFFAPRGVPDRATAALLSEYNFIRTGQERAGENAVSYDQIVPMAVQNIQTSVATSMAGHALADLGAVAANAKMQAYTWAGGGRYLGALAGNPQAQQAQATVEMAVYSLLAEQTINAGTFTWFGTTDPAYSAATNLMPLPADQINRKLVEMGYDPDAILSSYADVAKE